MDSIPKNLTLVCIISIVFEKTKVRDQILKIARRERLGEQRFIGDIGVERGSAGEADNSAPPSRRVGAMSSRFKNHISRLRKILTLVSCCTRSSSGLVVGDPAEIT
jgi:hypothetical protein